MTSQFEPRDPDFATRVKQSFSEQSIMQTLGAILVSVEPGKVEVKLPYQSSLTQDESTRLIATMTATLMALQPNG